MLKLEPFSTATRRDAAYTLDRLQITDTSQDQEEKQRQTTLNTHSNRPNMLVFGLLSGSCGTW